MIFPTETSILLGEIPIIFPFSACLEPRSRRPTRHSAPAGFAAEAADARDGE